MDKPVLIFGAGPLALAAIEIFESNKVVVFGILDDHSDTEGKEIGNVAVLSGTSDKEYLKLLKDQCEAFIATDDAALRKSLAKELTSRYKSMPVNAVHSTANISPYAHMGHGNFIDQGVHLGAGAEIGSHNLLHSGCTLGHGARLSDFVQMGLGVQLGAEVHIEEDVFIGTGAVIVPGIHVGKGARIGAGSVVVENVGPGTTVFGNPAKKVQV